jgi:hypothetical protein
MSPERAVETEAYSSDGFLGRVKELVRRTDASAGRRTNRTIVHWEDVFDWAAGGTAQEVCGGVTPALGNDSIVQV